MMSRSLALLIALTSTALAAPEPRAGAVELWGTFEASLAGPRDGNPFVDVELFADVGQGDRKVTVRGFCDGDGRYRFRFMPDRPGNWSWATRSNRPELNGRRGSFRVGAARANNHGPVRVRDQHH